MKKILLCLTIALLGVSVLSNAQIIMAQNFSGTTTPGLPTGWTNTVTPIAGSPALGWQTTTTTTNLYFSTVSNTPPHAEYAVCNEYADSGNNPSVMTSPVFNLATATTPFLSYDYVYNQVYYATPYTTEQAWVDISNDGGSTWHFLDSIVYITTGTWTNHTISLAAYAGSASCKVRFTFKDNGRWLMGCAIGNIIVFNSVANDIALTTVSPIAGSPSDYFLTSSSATFSGTMRNMGSTTITSFSASYQVGAAAPVVTNFTGLSVAPMANYAFSCTPYTVTTLGQQTVTMWVTEAGDPVLSNDTMVTAVIGVPFMPTKKIAIEEATGTWCGFCVRGIVYMDSLEKLHPGAASLVAVHNGDPMVVAAYNTWMGTKISGYPSIVVDRTIVDDPSNILSLYTQHTGDFGYANLSMTATVSGSTVTVPVTVSPAVNLSSGDYRLILVLTEDSVHSSSTVASTWDQHNYYNGGGYGALNIDGSAGYNFVTLPSVIPGATMYYNHVNRSIAPSALGTAGYIPGSMTTGSTYTHTFTGAITTGAAPTGWYPLRMHAVVLLTDGITGHVLNSQNVRLTFPVGVANINAGVEKLSLYPNPATNQVSVQLELTNNDKVQLDIVDMSGKTVYTEAAKELMAGNQVITLSTAAFATGVYNVRIQTNTGVVTERLTIVR